MTTFDYSPLTAPVTRQEVTDFRRASAGRYAVGAVTHSGLVLAVTIAAGLIALSILLSLYSSFFGGGSTVFVLIATMLVAAGVFTAFRLSGGQSKWARLVRLSRFAEANGLSFTSNGIVPNYPGAIFRVGSSRRVPERLSRAEKPAVDLGNLTYVTGSGKNRKTHNWGYLAIKLDRKLPQMVLDAKSNNFFGTNLPAKFSRNQVLSLEGDFDRYFTLYCPQEYERDALYVFTPDLMARLIDEAALFDVEIVDDWMFLYSARPLDLMDAATLARIFRIIDTVGDRAVDRTERYADDRATTDSHLPAAAALVNARMVNNTVAPQGRRLTRRFPVAGVIIFVVLFALWMLNFLPAVGRF